MRIDRATLQAAAITLAMAAPVHYTLEWLFLTGARLWDAVPAAVSEAAAPPLVAARVDAPPPVEVLAPPVEAVPVAVVSGTLRTPDGAPVPDEIVELAAPLHGQRHAGSSDRRGRFEIPGVVVGPSYRLSIDSEGRYGELVRPVTVADAGLQLDLVLEPIALADLSGRMVDPEGNPIPGRTLLVEASHDTRYALLVTGDAHGRFRVDGAPTGRLTFKTRTVPNLRARGPLLTPGSDTQVTVVLDEGDHELSGRVFSEHGAPIPGATLRLSWSYRRADLVSSSTRIASSASDGSFRFTELGAGPHLLVARAEGHEETRETFDVFWNSRDVELRLRPLGR